MGIFYTGKGDFGEAHVWDGKKLDKTSAALTALGDLDELNSLLGIIRADAVNKDNKKILLSVQENIFSIQANVYLSEIGQLEKAPSFGEEKTKELENLIDALEKFVEPERGFVIPGENSAGAWLDFARAVSRRTERNALLFHKQKNLPAPILSYLNRLSSLLFALARAENKNTKRGEKHPDYK